MNFHGTDVRQKALSLLRGGARNADRRESVALMDAHIGPKY
ncbi:hypothetical protein [Streptomyces sp. NPDC002133]